MRKQAKHRQQGIDRYTSVSLLLHKSECYVALNNSKLMLHSVIQELCCKIKIKGLVAICITIVKALFVLLQYIWTSYNCATSSNSLPCSLDCASLLINE